MYRKCYRYDELLPAVIPAPKEDHTLKAEHHASLSDEEAINHFQVDGVKKSADHHALPAKRATSSGNQGHAPQQIVHRHFTPAGHVPNPKNRRPTVLRKNVQGDDISLDNPPANPISCEPKIEDDIKSSVHIPAYEAKSTEVPSEEELKSSLTSFSQSATASLKGLYQRLRKDIVKNGKILGILETDDLIIVLLILILISEESDDYILLLALFALLFIK